VNRVVLDASALLTVLHDEPGAEILTGQSTLLEYAVASAVNVAEAYGKLLGLGMASEDAWEAVTAATVEIVAFDEGQARIVGELLPKTRSAGLSLGDRACLALGIMLKAPVYTADRAWKGLRLGVQIHMIR
jgi:ribonuclease VapC